MRIIHQNAFQSRDHFLAGMYEVPGSDVILDWQMICVCTSQVVMMNLDMVGATSARKIWLYPNAGYTISNWVKRKPGWTWLFNLFGGLYCPIYWGLQEASIKNTTNQAQWDGREERFLLVAQFVWGCFKIGNPTNALGMVELSNNNFKISGWLASEPSPSFINKSFATNMCEWVGENPAKQREKKGTHSYYRV